VGPGLESLTQLELDGGDGADVLTGGGGKEILIAGAGDDVVRGGQGNDVALLGGGNDRFEWLPGDGNDIVEGQVGADDIVVNGSGADEIVNVLSVGQRIRFTRNISNVDLDFDDIETVRFNAVGGADNITISDISGSAVTAIDLDLAGVVGGTAGDLKVDNVVVNGTFGTDTIAVTGGAGSVHVNGLSATVDILHAEFPNDGLTVDSRPGPDNVNVSGLAPGTIRLTVL
jgi:hypothetical protein